MFTVSSLPSIQLNVNTAIFTPDKYAHATEYFLLIYLYMKMRLSKETRMKKIYKEVLLIALVVPVFDELHQLVIPGRECSLYDMVADWIGIGCMVLIMRFRLRRNSHNEKAITDL